MNWFKKNEETIITFIKTPVCVTIAVWFALDFNKEQG